MCKAENRYLEYFQDGRVRNCSSKEVFLLGYHQAEKDLELSWEDIRTIDQLLWDLSPEWSGKKDNEGYFKEVLKRFKSYGKKEI